MVPPRDPAGSALRTTPGRVLREAVPVAALAVGIAVVVLRLWEASPRVPLRARGDVKFIEMLIKGISENGWWYHNPDLNAPYGQDLYDFPHGGEHLQLAVIKVLTWITRGDAGLTLNLYFVLGFGLLALVTYAVLRHLRFTPGVAAVVALLYTFLPFHFHHGVGHLFRSTYFTAPLAALLLLWALSPYVYLFPGEFPGDGAPGHRRLRGLDRRRAWAAVALCVVIASTETMTAAFTMTLLAVTGLVAALRFGDGRRLVVAGSLIAVLALTFLANNSGTLAYVASEGRNDEAARRHVFETESWGLKLNKMLLPHGGHRIDALADLGEKTQEDGPVPSEGGQSIGFLGGIGFLAALLGVVASGMGPPDIDPRHRPGRRDLLGRLGLLTLVSVFIGTVGGFSYFVALAGFAQVRVWNRIVLLIAFFAFVAVAIGLELLLSRLTARNSPRWIGTSALIVVVTLGVLDTTSGGSPAYDRLDALFARDGGFVRQVEQRLPRNGMVFQWPPIPFPEAGDVYQADDYDHLVGYLHSEQLRWSYGGIRGRDESMWQFELQGLPVDRIAQVIVAMGFDGVWVDTFAVLNGPSTTAAFEHATGADAFRSPDGRYAVFDLAPLRAKLEAQLTAKQWDQLRDFVLVGRDLAVPDEAPR